MMKIMKKIVLLLLFVFAVNTSQSGDKYWFKTLTGSINLYPVTMNLVKYGDELRGYYYYDKYKKPMVVYGNFSGDSLLMGAYYGYEDSETFKGIFSENTYKGVWTSKDGTLTQDFRLVENKSSSAGFEYVHVEGSERLFKELETPNAHYADGVVWPTEKYANSLFVRNAILKQMNKKTGLTEIGELMLADRKKFMKDFFEYNKDVKKEDVADGGWSYSLDQVDIIMPVYYDDNLFAISSYDYAYTGGAHGNYGTAYTNLDLKRRKILTLNDVLTKNGIEKMPALLEKYYKLERGIPPGTSLMESGLFVDTIRTNDNFLITPGNIMFNYIPYEISSYADGEVTIFIPYEEFSAYVKPEVRELFR